MTGRLGAKSLTLPEQKNKNGRKTSFRVALSIVFSGRGTPAGRKTKKRCFFLTLQENLARHGSND
jgi:hypothetical protein